MDELSSLHHDVCRNLDVILEVQTKYERQSIGDILELIKKKELETPSKETYFPDLSPEFLSASFMEEPMPGVYLPGSSNLSFVEAINLYKTEVGSEPQTLVDLNEFIHGKFEIPFLAYDPKIHTSVLPYSPLSGYNFYQKLA